ncbi:MAG: Ldh family oxidoreductase [bacterium]
MPTFSGEELRRVAFKIFEAAGAPAEEAKVVASFLVNADLVGHSSHGVIRIPSYVAGIRRGEIVPGAEIEVVRETPAVAVLNGNWGFGQVIGSKAMEIAIEKAQGYGVGAATASRCNHVGRLAEYPLMAAKSGLIGIAMVNNHGGGQRMAPWGGREARLSPNPIAFAVPTGDGPIVLDISSSVVAEGKVRVKLYRGEPIPEGWVIDSQGRPTTNPADLYGPPPGAILPFGGIAGHKGYGLGFVIDILAGALSGAGCSRANPPRAGNGVLMMALDIRAFTPIEAFEEEVRALIRYMKSCPTLPGVSEILVPGEVESREFERRSREGIFVEDETWRQVRDVAETLGVRVDLQS